MIQVIKQTEIPQILVDNATTWTNDLLAKIDEIKAEKDKNKLKKLQDEKDKLEGKYNCEEVKIALKNSSTKNKCVFCECIPDVSNYGEIEHFYPKSLYPEKTFEWDNLFWSCKRCNNPKLNYDTFNLPFLHPANDNAEDYFYYRDLLIEPIVGATKFAAAEATKNICRLNARSEVIAERSKILRQFYENSTNIEELLNELNELNQNVARFRKIEKLHNKLVYLKSLSHSEETYAGFLRYFLKQSPIIQKAISTINERHLDLGLTTPFALY
jgi:uncharacterized protein (TIGR02646 family)